MSLMNLFSKPLNFISPDNVSEKNIVQSDKINDLQHSTPKNQFLDGNQLCSSELNKPDDKNIVKKNNKIKTPGHHKYIDFDSEMDSVSHKCSNPWATDNNVSSINQSLDYRGTTQNRPLISYDDDNMFSGPRIKQQGRKDKNLDGKKKVISNIKKTNKNKKSKKNNTKKVSLDLKLTDSNKIQNLAPGNAATNSSHQTPGCSAKLTFSKNLFENHDSKCLKRKAEDDDKKPSKIRKVYDECVPLFSDNKPGNVVNNDMKNKTKEPLSNKQLRKIEKSRLYREKLKERQAKEATHQQGIQKKLVAPCKFYVNGCCNKGSDCMFSHEIPQEIKDEPCKFYIISQCTKGEACLYRHKEWPCKFYHTQKGCKNDVCKFSHEPLTDITKQWLDKITEEEAASKTEDTNKEPRISNSPEVCAFGSFYGAHQSHPHVPAEHNNKQEPCQSESFYGVNRDSQLKLKQEPCQPESFYGVNRDSQLNSNYLESFYGNSSYPKVESKLTDNQSSQFNLIQIDVNKKNNVSLFDFFKNDIESHRQNGAKVDDEYLPHSSNGYGQPNLYSNLQFHY